VRVLDRLHRPLLRGRGSGTGWAWAAPALYVTGPVLAFGVRTWAQIRATGTARSQNEIAIARARTLGSVEAPISEAPGPRTMSASSNKRSGYVGGGNPQDEDRDRWLPGAADPHWSADYS
jgi:hypothetical protein